MNLTWTGDNCDKEYVASDHVNLREWRGHAPGTLRLRIAGKRYDGPAWKFTAHIDPIPPIEAPVGFAITSFQLYGAIDFASVIPESAIEQSP